MRLFYFLARNISYTFAVSFVTVFGGWVGGFFGFFIGTSFMIAPNPPVMILVFRLLIIAVVGAALAHYIQFGMLTPLRIPAFFKSLRTINNNLKGNELRGDIRDEELVSLYKYISELPIYNLITCVFYAVLVALFIIINSYFNMRVSRIYDMNDLRLIVKTAGIGVMVMWVLYAISTYLFTEIITGRERATCYNELINRKIFTRPRPLGGIRLKLGYFVILMILAMITFAAMMEKSRFLPGTSIYIVVYFGLSVATAVFLMSINANSIVNVLKEMQRVSKAISTGKDTRFKVLSVDREFSNIEFSLMEMAREIDEYRRNLELKVEQRTNELQVALKDLKDRDDMIQKQLDIASTIQRGILPGKIDDWNELKFSVRYIAMEKIGGDFYDVYQLRGNKLGLLIADVSGHGIPAALVTTMAKIAFGNACMKTDSPKKIFQDVNQNLLEHVKTQDYLTSFFLAIDEDYNVTYSNASHQKAILMKTNEGTIDLLDTNGLFIGAIEDAHDTYEEKRTHLNYGDRLILYTDGIPEAIDAGRSEYTIDRLQAAVKKNQSLSLEDFTNAIIEDVQRFIGNARVEDDITLLVVELSRDEAIDIIKKSKRMIAEDRYHEAIEFIERGLQSFPENRKLMYNLAKNYFRVNNYAKTLEYINRYVEYDRRNKYAFYIGGAACYQMMDFTKAIELLEESIRIDPAFTNALFALGMAYKKKGVLDDAAKCFERVVAVDEDNKMALFELKELKKGR